MGIAAANANSARDQMTKRLVSLLRA